MIPSERAELLNKARGQLESAGVWDVDGDLDALSDRFLGPADAAAAVTRFLTAVDERCSRIPLGHITGQVTFDGLSLAVGSGVFVPRAESVPLVLWAAGQEVVPLGGLVLDLCAGVGPLGLAISRRRPDLAVVCVERSDTAVQYLRRNLARHRAAVGRATVHEADLFDPRCLDGYPGADLIVANPPYVAPDVRLLPEWSEHQPRDAIYSGTTDGLDLVRVIIAHALRTLRPGGRLAFEHDRSQPEPVRALLADAGCTDITTTLDSAGETRITHCRVPAGRTA